MLNHRPPMNRTVASPFSTGLLAMLLLAGDLCSVLAGPPVRFVSRGPGGGGAFFAPAINPHRPDEAWVGSDMGDLFHSVDFGGTWETVDFRVLQGGSQPGRMAFTRDPRVFYALNGDVPARSTDGGTTWIPIPADPEAPSAYCLLSDPGSTQRLLVSDYSTLRVSTNSGATYSRAYSADDLFIAGAFWDGPSIYVGTRPGLVVSTNGGASFLLAGLPGIPATEAIVSFAGSREGSLVRLYCVTLGSGDVYPGVQGSDYGNYQGIYRLDLAGGTGAGGGSWVPIPQGVGGNRPFFVATSPANTSVVYLAGSDGSGQPSVLKSTNAGDTWVQVMNCTGNKNIRTGWTGDDPGPWNWKKWSFGECAMGFAVCATDPDRLVITDFGFIHVSTNGGATWRQAYAWQNDETAAGTPTPKNRFVTGNGAEDTSCWSLNWISSNRVFASYTDVRGMLSLDAGVSWMSPASLTYNSTYQTVRHPISGVVYGAMSSVHDLYTWDRYCQDASIDGGSGEVMMSADGGLTWGRLRNLGKPVVGLALDPRNPARLYAAMVNSTSGGIYRTTNLDAGTAAGWTRLAAPPRTQGHPCLIQVLDDGTLVAAYSARINGGGFQPSSGVFVSTDEGVTWADRTAAGMKYYTKDLVLDPHDPAQARWYAGVWGEWGASAGLGGLYATTNRGISWTRVTSSLKAVSSCTIDPLHPDEMYVTTENQGLWFSGNRRDANPTFASVAGYPFRFPTRVYFNPCDANEIWVTSYGNGLRLGRRIEPAPVLSLRAVDPGVGLELGIEGGAGQEVTLTGSSDLTSWEDLGSHRVFRGKELVRNLPAGGARRYFRGEVR